MLVEGVSPIQGRVGTGASPVQAEHGSAAIFAAAPCKTSIAETESAIPFHPR